jgi:hypothetical protein
VPIPGIHITPRRCRALLTWHQHRPIGLPPRPPALQALLRALDLESDALRKVHLRIQRQLSNLKTEERILERMLEREGAHGGGGGGKAPSIDGDEPGPDEAAARAAEAPGAAEEPALRGDVAGTHGEGAEEDEEERLLQEALAAAAAGWELPGSWEDNTPGSARAAAMPSGSAEVAAAPSERGASSASEGSGGSAGSGSDWEGSSGSQGVRKRGRRPATRTPQRPGRGQQRLPPAKRGVRGQQQEQCGGEAGQGEEQQAPAAKRARQQR